MILQQKNKAFSKLKRPYPSTMVHQIAELGSYNQVGLINNSKKTKENKAVFFNTLNKKPQVCT